MTLVFDVKHINRQKGPSVRIIEASETIKQVAMAVNELIGALGAYLVDKQLSQTFISHHSYREQMMYIVRNLQTFSCVRLGPKS